MEPALHSPAPAVAIVLDAPDRELLSGVVRRDRAAFETLYRRWSPRLLGYLLRLTRRRELAEEALNDTMLVIWRQAAAFAGTSRVSTWIFGIAYRKGLKALERDRRGAFEPVGGRTAEPIDPGGPDRDLAAREMARVVGRALARLPPDQRTVIEMACYQELPYREVASALGCPVNTVKTRMFHARRKLRTLLPPQGGERREAERAR